LLEIVLCVGASFQGVVSGGVPGTKLTPVAEICFEPLTFDIGDWKFFKGAHVDFFVVSSGEVQST